MMHLLVIVVPVLVVNRITKWCNFDLDNLCNDIDDCPYDAENDADQDGICGDVDECPYDAENDADQDGICGDVDDCPYDAENDVDQDEICGDVDGVHMMLRMMRTKIAYVVMLMSASDFENDTDKMISVAL